MGRRSGGPLGQILFFFQRPCIILFSKVKPATLDVAYNI